MKHLVFVDAKNMKPYKAGFSSTAMAKAFLDELLRGAGKWMNVKCIVLHPLVVTSDDLEEIMECEQRVGLLEPFVTEARLLRRDAGLGSAVPRSPRTGTSASTVRSSKSPPAGAAGMPSGGTVDAAALAQRLGLSPRELRARLRAAGVARPYRWTEEEARKLGEKL